MAVLRLVAIGWLALLVALAGAYCPASDPFPLGLSEQEYCAAAYVDADGQAVCLPLRARGARTQQRLTAHVMLPAAAIVLLRRALRARQARLLRVRRRLLYFYVNCPELAPPGWAQLLHPAI